MVLKALGVVFQGIGVVVSILITNLELLLAALVGLAASALAPALVAIAGGFAKITRAIKAGTLAAMIFQSVTLGPLGMTKIAAGIAGATAAYVLLESQVSKLTDEMKGWAVENNGRIWTPTMMTLPMGMLYPFNEVNEKTETENMYWKVAYMKSIPEEEQKNYPVPGYKDAFYKKKYDTDNSEKYNLFLQVYQKQQSLYRCRL